MNIFEPKLDLLILHITIYSMGAIIAEPPYPRSHYVPQTAYVPHYKYEEASTTEASKTFKIEVDVPQLIRSYMGLPEPQSRSEGATLDSQKFQLELKTPDLSQMWEAFKNILREGTNADRRHEGAYVEEGPGSFKSQPVDYPKNFHENNLLKLLQLKKKMGLSRRGYGYDDVLFEY